MEEKLPYYIHCFTHLKRDAKNGGAPHKPILLLSIIRLFEKVFFNNNQIFILQELVDYGDISGMVETFDKVQMGFGLKKLLDELDEKGYYLFGERNIERIKYANGETDKWSIATIVIKKKDSSEIIKLDLNEIEKTSTSNFNIT